MFFKALIFCLIVYVVLFAMAMLVAALIKFIAFMVQRGEGEKKINAKAGHSA